VANRGGGENGRPIPSTKIEKPMEDVGIPKPEYQWNPGGREKKANGQPTFGKQ